jgi:hypothetical protein
LESFSLTKAYVDTTVLTDALLKSGPIRDRAIASLKAFDTTQLPVYAIKEFKRGPFSNYVWMHNKFAATGSYARSIEALHAMSRTPKRYITSTALEALFTAADSIGHRTSAELATTYGADATLDSVQCAEIRLSLKRKIYSAWANRRNMTTDIVDPLSCYNEKEPYEKRGLIETKPVSCDREDSCCLATQLRAKADELRKMKQAIDDSKSVRREDAKRGQALRFLFRKKEGFTDAMCRDLGDAVFVAFAPRDAVILTTNTRDYVTLATSIGKQVQIPTD